MSTCQKSERAVFPKNKMTVKSVRVQKDRRHSEHQSKQTRKGFVQKQYYFYTLRHMNLFYKQHNLSEI